MKRKIKIKKVINIIAIMLLMLIIMTDVVLAINVDYYKPSELTGADKVKDIGNVIIGIIQVIGSALSVIVLICIGIKYLVGSVEEKAEYKETLKPYIIGAFMVFAITNILGVISRIMSKAF